jgi:hypothetical protein
MPERLHNRLHSRSPNMPKHPELGRVRYPQPVENKQADIRVVACGTEGRGFKPRRSPQTFQSENKVFTESGTLTWAQHFAQSLHARALAPVARDDNQC